MDHRLRGGGESAISSWSLQTQPTNPVTKFQPCLESLLDSEASLWGSPELRVVGQESSHPILTTAWHSHSHEGQALLKHGSLVTPVHDYYLNLEKNRCCLTLAGRRHVINSVRVVHDNTVPEPTSPPPPQQHRAVHPRHGVANRSSRQNPRRGSEVVLAGDNLTLYQSSLLSAFLPVLAAPGPPSPFTPAMVATPTDVTATAGFSFGGAATAGDKEVPSLRMSAAASALANLEKDFGSTGELSSFVSSIEHQYDRQGIKKGAEPPALDSVTTEMLRELVRLVFQQTEQQQMCTEHDLRDAVGRRSYSEVLARHLMARLSVLENNSHQFYRPTAFLCPQAYDEWVQGEKQHIKQLLNRFWHYSLPHPSRTSSSASSSSLSTRLLRADHHAAYMQLLDRVVHQQESIKGHPGVPLLPTARRLLKEFALRFGVGELFCRIAYLRLLSQNMEHDVWFCRHVCVSLLAVLELLPVKPSQRTTAVKSELERLHEAVATLHSHIDHALTRIHILFPGNAPPDGIASMLQLLSLVLFTQRYLTNQPGQSVSHWLQRYLDDGFEWRFEYHKTVLSAELEIMSAVKPLTPALLNGLLVEIRNEVLGLADFYEPSFKRYFSISQLGRRSFYQLLMKDVQELCQFQHPSEQLELDMLALMYRLAELDKCWVGCIAVSEQVWREPFFRLVLSWLHVLQKHAVRWLLTACINDKWSTLTLPGFESRANAVAAAAAGAVRVPLTAAPDSGAITSTPVMPVMRGLRSTMEQSSVSPMSSLFGDPELSAFSRHETASNMALAGSLNLSRSEVPSQSYVPTDSRTHVSSLPSVASLEDSQTSRRTSLLQRSLASNDLQNSLDRILSLPLDEGKLLSHTPVLTFMCRESSESLSPLPTSENRLSSSQHGSRRSSGPLPVTSSSVEQQPQQQQHVQRPVLFRSDNLIPARPAVLQAPRLSVIHSHKNALFKPVARPAGAPDLRSASQFMPSPVPTSPESRHVLLAHAGGGGDDDSTVMGGHYAAVAAGGGGGGGGGMFGSPVKPVAIAASATGGAQPSSERDRHDSVSRTRIEEWVASQSEDSSHDRGTAVAASRSSSSRAPTTGNEHPQEHRSSSMPRSDGAFNPYHSRPDSSAFQRKISAQSNDSIRTDSWQSSLAPNFVTGSMADHEAVLPGVDRNLPVSSSLIDFVVVLSRLTNTVAMLTDVICPTSALIGGSSNSGSGGLNNSAASSPTPVALVSGRVRSVSVSSVGDETEVADVQWHKSMDVAATACAMYHHVFMSALDMLSECATLYADNMLCADLCGIPEGIAAHLIGQSLLDHIKAQREACLLWGCRHHDASQRCSSSRAASPTPDATAESAAGRAPIRYSSVPCSAQCATGGLGGGLPGIEPIAAEMCTRVNNVMSLLSAYPLLQSIMLGQVCQKWQLPGRDSGLPFTPSLALGPAVTGKTDKRCNDVCAHLGQVLDGMIYIIAYRINQFAAPCLQELLSLHLPASYSLGEHLQPLDLYLSRHLSKIKLALYEECFQSLLLVLWKMTVQNIHKVFADWQTEKKKVRLDDRACFLLRVTAHFMQFFHSCKAGLDMELVSNVARPLLQLLDVFTMPTGSLASLHQRLSHRQPDTAADQNGMNIPPGLVTALYSDLHAKKKCFSGGQLSQRLAARCGQFGLSGALQSRQRLAQHLLSFGVIRPVDDSQSGPSTRMPAFHDSNSALYRFTESEESSSDTQVGHLLSSLQVHCLDSSRLDDSAASTSRDASSSSLRTASSSSTSIAIDSVVNALRNRCSYDRTAKAYLSRSGLAAAP